jgi:predicted RNA-binding Zn ribbon-like protein
MEPPHRLALVIDFVNTLDLETGIDELATPHGLAAWLVDRNLLDPRGALIEETQREQAIRLREALRALMLGHNGVAPAREAAQELEQAAHRGKLAVRFASDGSSRLAAEAKGLAGSLAQLLIPVVDSAADGSWDRVKACRADDCLGAFYDHSRNRAGVWCEMAACGNRAKVRAYRSRKLT